MSVIDWALGAYPPLIDRRTDVDFPHFPEAKI